MEGDTYKDPPSSFSNGERYEVYFPISKFLEGRDWDTVLVVFSGPDGLAAETEPRTSFRPFSFKGKEKLFPDWDPSVVEEVAGPAAPPGSFDLEIRRVKRSDWPMSLWFNGDWRRDQECVEAEVRVVGGIPRKSPEVRLYLYDRENRPVGKRDIPSMASIGNQEYIKVPKIAEEKDWYPVVFALDEKLEFVEWRTAVVVFTIGDQSVAEIYSRSGASLEDVEFAEKSRVMK